MTINDKELDFFGELLFYAKVFFSEHVPPFQDKYEVLVILEAGNYWSSTVLQFPFEFKFNMFINIKFIRQKLYGVMKRVKHEGRHVSLVRDKLYIEGEFYVLPDNCREQMETTSSPNPQPSLPQTPF
jgi:hypothetical protein